MLHQSQSHQVSIDHQQLGDLSIYLFTAATTYNRWEYTIILHIIRNAQMSLFISAQVVYSNDRTVLSVITNNYYQTI